MGDDVAENVEPIVEESLDNLREATQRLRATQNRMLAADMQDQPNYRHLFVQVSTALAITEASIVEARRMLGKLHTGYGHDESSTDVLSTVVSSSAHVPSMVPRLWLGASWSAPGASARSRRGRSLGPVLCARPGPSPRRSAVGTKRGRRGGLAFLSGLQRGPKEGRINGTHTAMFRPRRLCIIAIIPVRCKESPLRPGRGGIRPLGPEARPR